MKGGYLQVFEVIGISRPINLCEKVLIEYFAEQLK